MSDDELAAVWKAACLDPPYDAFVKLLILTGARCNEVAEMHWQELDLAAKLWILPRGRSKNDREHTIPLSDVAAILASGATSAADLAARSNTSAADLWWCVLAHRTRDLSAADRLVAIAIDPTRLWQVRRAAIAAAGRLPYEAALARIEPAVMAERSPFTLDRHPSRFGHASMANMVSADLATMRSIFDRGRTGFIGFFADIFDTVWREASDRACLPDSAEAAGWLYDRLADGGWPALTRPRLTKCSTGCTVRSCRRLCCAPCACAAGRTELKRIW